MQQRGAVSLQLLILISIIVIAVSTILLAYFNAKVAAHDKQRLSDITMMRAALKLYFDENDYYPAGQNGKPEGIEAYINFWPTAPRYGCSKNSNYTYAPKSNNTDYSLNFCMDTNGQHTANSTLIQ